MKASLSWLSQYVDLTLSASELAHGLTMAGLEVEKVEDRFASLSTVLAARVIEAAPHPTAPGISVCKVSVGETEITVVCGASNVRAGMISALALPGTVLADGTEVEAGNVHGIASQAMLCSAAELGVGADASGVMELPADTAVGTPLNKVLGLSDWVFEINVTPNRPDCLSMIGIAREAAVLCKTALKRPKAELMPESIKVSERTSVTILAPELCPRYVARLLYNVKIGPSPFWLADRLRSVGLRPINNIVDVTNFVMMETGQPLHAFDFDTLAENRIVVRTGSDGEDFTTLDGKTVKLTGENLMICDGEKPVALAGVMGGLYSEISADTKNVLIESAHFNPMSIRKTAKRLGYHTDASHRFERGTDPDVAPFACARAAVLMLDVAGGIGTEGAVDAYPLPYEPRRVSLSAATAGRNIGISISRDEIKALLDSIDIPCEDGYGDTVVATAPGFRPDITRSEDIVEEVARLFGYDNIPTTAPMFAMEAPVPDPFSAMCADLRRISGGMGFFEAVNFSFMAQNAPENLNIPENDPRRRILPVANPLAEDQAVMRTSLVPGILNTVALNLSRQNRDLRLFETGKVFWTVSGEPLPEEPEMLVMALTGVMARSWKAKEAPCDFYDIKGAAQGLLASLRINDAVFTKVPASETFYYRPGRTARITARGAVLGTVGEARADVLARFGVKQSVFLAEFDLKALFEALPGVAASSALPKFPSTSRDVTLIMAREIESVTVCQKARELSSQWVESVEVVAVYEKKPNPEGKKSLSLRLVYRASDRTLTDAFVNAEQERITSALLDAFNAAM